MTPNGFPDLTFPMTRNFLLLASLVLLNANALADTRPLPARSVAGAATLTQNEALESEVFPNQALLKAIVNKTLEANHSEAFVLADEYIQKNKSHPCAHFVLGLVHESQIEPQIPEPYLGPAIDAFEKAGQMEKSAVDVPWSLCRGASLMRLARIYYKYGKTVLGVRRGIAGGRELERVAVLAGNKPQFADVYAFIGPYHYFTDRAPAPAKVVMRMFGLKGDRQLGLKELTTAWQQAPVFRYEAGHILAFAKMSYENNKDDAIEIVAILRKTFPDNIIFQRLEDKAYARASMRNVADEKLNGDAGR